MLSSSQKPKTAAVQELGFSPKQVERFETLADNKDLVEREKAVAREEGRMPTRTNVIHMAKERKAREQSALEAHARRMLASVRDENGKRAVLAVKNSPGRYINISIRKGMRRYGELAGQRKFEQTKAV